MNVTAVAQRSGGWWAISVREAAGVFTQARRLDQVPGMVSDAIALMRGIDSSEVDVNVIAHTDQDSLIAHARESRAAAEAAAVEASRATREAARALLADGFTVRDAGRLLNLSQQRISQLVA